MRIDVSKEWCARMAQLEADAEIGAGLLSIDPVFDGEVVTQVEEAEGVNFAFGRFVRLMRRSRHLTVEKLADDADVEISELVNIEEDAHYKAELRTVYQLAEFFDVQKSGLLQVAGLTVPKDARLVDEAVRFAARSEPVAELTREERAALDAFVAVLSEQK